MKQLLSLVLAFQLISFPVIGATSSESQQATESQQLTEKEKELADPNKNAEIDTGTNAEYDARSNGGAGFQNFSKQIVGASTAIIGSNIIATCTWGAKVPSILAFMGGAIAYLISEVSGGKKQNQEHKERLKRVEQIKEQIAANKGGGDVQRVLIEQRLEEEEKILEFVKERSTWGKAIMAIYLLAAGLAITEEVTGMAAGLAAGTSTCAMLAAQYASPCGPGYAGCYASHFAACNALQPTGQVAAKAAFMTPGSLGAGAKVCTANTAYAPACLANLNSYAAIAFANCIPLGAGTVSATVLGHTFTANLYAAAFGLGIGYNSAGNLQSLLQLAVTLTSLFTKALTIKITALYSYPIPRSITFAAHAALMGVVIGGLEGVKSDTEKNITKLKAVVNKFKEHTNDSNGMEKGGHLAEAEGGDYKNINSQGGSPQAVSLKNDPKALNKIDMNVSKSKTCFSNESGEIDVSEKACKNAVKVNPITVNLKDNKGNLKAGVQHLNDLSRSISEGNTESARASAVELASMANSLRQSLTDMQNEYNKKLPKKDRVDFDAEVRKISQELEAEDKAKQIFDQFQKEQGIKVAAFAPQSKSSLDASSETAPSQEINEAKSDKQIAVANGEDKTTAEEGITLSEGEPEELSAITEEEFLYGGDKTSKNPYGLNEDAYRAASANGYLHLHGKNGYGAGEGVASQQENLFKVISNRYFLSYPKIMRRKIGDAQNTQ